MADAGRRDRIARTLVGGMRRLIGWRVPWPLKAPFAMAGYAALGSRRLADVDYPITTAFGARLTGGLSGSTLNPGIAVQGMFEPTLTRVIQRLVGPGSICMDVGANAGYFTLLMAQLVGEEGRVIAVEPAPASVSRLRANLEANGLAGRVEVVEAACGAEAGKTTFHVHRHNDMWSRVEMPKRGEPLRVLGGPAAWEPITVPVDTLSVMAGRDVDRVTMIKLDIEGGEADVCATLPSDFPHPDLCVAVEALAPHIEATLQPFRAAGFHAYDLKNNYRWMVSKHVEAASPVSYEDLYRRRLMVDVLVSRTPLPPDVLRAR